MMPGLHASWHAGSQRVTVTDAQDPSPYSPVWVRTDDPETEHVGSIISVTHTDGVQGGGAGGAEVGATGSWVVLGGDIWGWLLMGRCVWGGRGLWFGLW